MSTIEIAGRGGKLIISLLRYERDSASNYSDANWLSSELEVDITPFSGTSSVTFMTHDFTRFLEQLQQVDSNFTGDVTLECEVGKLRLTIKFKPQWSISIQGSIKSDVSNSMLAFDMDSDERFINKLIEDLEMATRVFPVRGTP